MRSGPEALTRNFYAWENRGRGWQQWPRPVALQPPVRPFFGHFIVPYAAAKDDGRRETLLSRFVDSFSAREQQPQVPALLEELFAEPDPVFVAEKDDITELTVALPEGTRTDNDAASAFLLSLDSCRDPVSFEVIGSAERIAMQLAAHTDDAPHVT